jgi:hypothetical protein
VKIGAEDKKKLGALVGFGALAVYLVYSNFFAGPSVPATVAGPAPVGERRTPAAGAPERAASASRAPVRQRSEEWHPVVHAKRPEDRIDPATVDPTLRLDLLAKLEAVPAAGSGRNLFGMSAEPPKLPDHKEPIVQVAAKRTMGPPPIPPPPGPPGPPPLPPITFKYYGIATVRADGTQTAFFMEGEDILIKSVGDTVAGSYKLVRIGQNSAVVEDTQSKRTQTVPLAQEAQV